MGRMRAGVVTRSFIAGIGGCICLAGPTPLEAQTISPRTVPVLMAQQFEILPSDRAAMGGVMIALDDDLLDPFVNPATASRARTGRLSIAPYFHSLSASDVGGRTLPISGIASFGNWSAGGLVALQSLDRARLRFNAPVSERTASNRYLMGILSRRFGDHVSIGASGYWAELGAEQGIDQLYSGSDRIVQDGSSSDLRLGLASQWRGSRVLEVVALRSNFDMSHDVRFPTFRRWLPNNTFTDVPERQEHHQDHTRRWGAHATYTQPIGSDGWRIGWLGTVNRLSHPKIPDYRINEVITVPRDPGHTWGYNAGMGVSRVTGRTTLGLDVVLEPIYSTTWAEAARDTVAAGGRVIPRGAHTVDNEFRFSNTMMRFGFSHEWPQDDSTNVIGLRAGLGVHAMQYRLWQDDLVRDSSRVQDEHWMEWTPTLGFLWRTPGMEFRYTASLTCGAGGSCTGCFLACGDDVSVAAPSDGGVIAAPTDALRFNAGRAMSHRFAFTLKGRW